MDMIAVLMLMVMMMLIYNDDDVIVDDDDDASDDDDDVIQLGDLFFSCSCIVYRYIPDRQHMFMKTIILINVTVTYCFVVTSIDR